MRSTSLTASGSLVRRSTLVIVGLLGGAASAQGSGDHWAYRPFDDSARSRPHDGQSTIDDLAAARLDAAGLTRSPEAERATLARRLYLVLHGLPPTPEQVARVQSADAGWYERLVDELLASPRYGERWARHWLDVVRYADTHGFETNTPRPTAWRYRDWVIDALNRDLGYDRFVTAQLAGDTVGMDAATGFLVAGPWDSVKSPDERLTKEQRQNELADMVGAVGTAFLGTTIGCARCHDHKFDPIQQTDFYAVEAVVAGVQHGERELRPPDDPARRARIDALEQQLDALEAELAAFEPVASPVPIAVLDDEDEDVEILFTKQGHGANPAGAARGHAEDPGDRSRLPNISRGRYTWWHNEPGRDAIAWRPGRRGAHQLWVSWGCGWATHSSDAIWLLDRDGDLATRDDQRELAVVDQQRFADGGGTAPSERLPSKPLWSGLLDVGVVELEAESRIVLRGGAHGTALTADVIVLRPASASRECRLPPLRPPVHALGAVDRFAPIRAHAVRMTIEATSNGIEPCIDELEVFTAGAEPRNVALASSGARATASSEYPNNAIHKIAHANDGAVGNAHSWIPNEKGQGWLQIDLATPGVIDRVAWARDRTGRYTDRTPVRYRIEVRGTNGAWFEVASSVDRVPHAAANGRRIPLLPSAVAGGDQERVPALLDERHRLTAELDGLRQLPRGYIGRFTDPPPTHRLHRGDPLAPRELVPPGAIAAFGPLDLAPDPSEPERRVALARWVVTQPVTARVIVNRIWHHHVGSGFVATPNDFGHNGAPPSHPALLDALARDLVADDWSLKRLHKRILMSATWRQRSAPHPTGLAVDADCRLLWRFPPRRLEAESIRDAMLAATGELDPTMGGPGFDLFEPNTNYVRVYTPRSTFGPDTLRRAVYAYQVRMEKDPTFGVFDCPDGGQSTPKRARSTTALQALSLLNSPFVVQRADAFAARLEAEAPDDLERRVHRAFALAFQRAPSAEETTRAADLVTRHGLPALCRALFNTNEFLFVP